jgi:hypothetical protein
MTIWIIKQSRDGGATWRLHTPCHLYKNHDTAIAAEGKQNEFAKTCPQPRWIYRAAEYKAVSA